jgi:uncharacterized membrane protein HdeD (DUF308 family)
MPLLRLVNREARAAASRLWWIYVLSGFGWLLVALIVFRFDWASVQAIGILFGVIAVSAGSAEFGLAAASEGGWRWLRYLIGVVFIAGGVVSFFTPGDAFVALAALISFFFVIAGTFSVVNAIATRGESDVWWLTLISGALEIGLGFWAAGGWNESATLLVSWVGAITTFRGVSMIVFGFKLHSLVEEPKPPAGRRAAAKLAG